jgi:hypothetical protein
MAVATTAPPGRAARARGLAVLLRTEQPQPLAVLGRKWNPYSATFASEVITCRLDDRVLTLFCKYGPDCHVGPDGRRGVPHEADVYREVLHPAGHGTARFYGSHRDDAGRQHWLVIEHLEQAEHAHRLPSPDAGLVAAAGWIGMFHGLTEEGADGPSPSVLPRYDRGHYAKWPRRTSTLAGELHRHYPWLAAACQGFEEHVVEDLLTAPHSAIHGDYYPDNVLVSEDRICPVDWEWAALAPGEIDLAALTFRWPPEVVAACESAYRQARWPGGQPPEHGRRLAAARLYLCLRYMGNGRDWLFDDRRRWRFDAVRELSEQLEVI